MRKAVPYSLLATLLIVSIPIVSAQEFQIKLDGKSDENIFLLPECMAVLVDEDETIQVRILLPAESRPEGYGNLDLKERDEILMANAKRVKKVKDLKAIYEGVKAGETVKLGIRRGEEMFIVSFAKVDPEKMPRGRMQISTEEGGPGGGITMKLANLGNGLAVKEVNKQVFIHKILPPLKDALQNIDLKEGDRILSLNDQKIETNQQFIKAWSQIKNGVEVHLKISRDGKQFVVTFNKPGSTSP